MPVGINCTTSSFDLAPPVSCLVEEGSVGASKWDYQVPLQPDGLSLTGVIHLTAGQVFCLLGVKYTLNLNIKT